MVWNIPENPGERKNPITITDDWIIRNKMIIKNTGNSLRWHCKLLIAVICVFLIGMVLMMAGPRSGLENTHTISDLNSLYVRIPYAAGDIADHRTPEELSEVYRNSHQQNVDTASKAEVVMIVTTAEELELTTASIGQKVRIDRILRGDVSIQEGDTCTVWLAARLYADGDQITYDGVQNLMQPGRRYLVLLENTSLNEYYGKHDNFLMINEGIVKAIEMPYTTLSIISEKRTAPYADWKEYAYFISVPEIAEEYDSICHDILIYYGLE